jgi:hypothetical protein
MGERKFMIKQIISLSLLFAGATTLMSQTTPSSTSQRNPGNDVISRPPGAYSPNAAPTDTQTRPSGYNPVQTGNTYNQPGAGGVLFSNRVGQTYSAQDLAFQLQNLRNVVDQTLPILSAFNESYSNSNNGGHQTIGGALSGIVSDVLHRNQNQTQNSTPSTTGQSLSTSNLLSALQGLLHKNSSTSTSTTMATADPQDLISLQTDLQPVITVLQRLNVLANSNQIVTPYPNPTIPTPTGR